MTRTRYELGASPGGSPSAKRKSVRKARMRTVAIWVTLVLLATPAYYWYLLPKTKRFGDWAGRTWQTLAG